jgi:hypothetical protein
MNSPDNAFGNIPNPDDPRFNTDGLELAPLDGEAAASEKSAPAEEVYTAEMQSEDAARFSVAEKPVAEVATEVADPAGEEVVAEQGEIMTEEEKEAQIKEFSTNLGEALSQGDANAAEALLVDATEKGIEIDIRSVVNESVKDILRDASSTTYGKIVEIMKFAKDHEAEPDLQALYQEEMNSRYQKNHPQNLQDFMNAAEEQGVEVSLDVERVAKGHREFIEGQLRMVTDRDGSAYNIAINSVFAAIDFAKKHGVDLGDLKELISNRK